jgi:glycine/D-amino acid oxidase-like deaminating enzyme
MLSFWEKNTFCNYDYIIIGAGITGLSVACELKENHPNKSVLVLERGLLPTGASTKNAGFACIGSLSENLEDIKLMGENAFLQLVQDRWQGLQILRKRLGDAAIQFEGNGGFELVLKHQNNTFLNKLHDMNKLLLPLFNKPIFSVQTAAAKTYGLNQNLVDTCVKNEVEGQINTGQMMLALQQYAAQLGVQIITGAAVLSITENTQQVSVQTTSICFTAQHLFICTNAFAKQLLPHVMLEPGRGQVLVTAPIPNLKVKGTFFFDEGYYYFRNFENRIIFGGGRNLDFETENTLAFGSNQKILAQLNYYLQELILPNTNYEIAHTWSGIMAFGSDKTPLVKNISERQTIALRLNGMGVALGSMIARRAVKLAQV